MLPKYNKQDHIEMFISIGDSHSGIFKPPHAQQIHLGPVTMHRVGRDTLNAWQVLSQLPKDAVWVFSFGEIDVRCHVNNQVLINQRTPEEIIRTLVQGYENALNLCVQTYGVQVGVLGIPPPCRYAEHKNNPLYPFLGSDDDRLAYTMMMNSLLSQMCNSHNWVFFDTYPHYHDESGFLKEVISDGNVHIADPTHVTAMMENYIYIHNNKQQ
jgi:hypothetical protein